VRVTDDRIVRATGLVLLLAFLLPSLPAHATVRSQALYARGLVPFNNGQWEQAYRLFDQAVQADPTDAMALYYRGLTQARRGAPAQAIQDMEAALKLDPTLPHAALDLGIEYFNTGRYAEAKTWLERAHQQPAEIFTAAFFLGLTYYRLGDYTNAQLELESAKADPDLRGPAAYYAGLALLRQEKKDAARAEFGQAARDQPAMPIGETAQRYLTTGSVQQPPIPAAGLPQKPWSVYGQLDFGYDSNVVIGPNDSPVPSPNISRKDDGFTAVGAGGVYRLLDTDVGSLQVSYDFYQSIHFQLTQFDLQGHRLRLDAASKPGQVQYGITGTYDFYALDYQTFFQEGLGTPWLAYNEGPASTTQVYYTLRGRDYFRAPYDPGRNSIDNALGLRQYLELGRSDRLLGFGYQFDFDDTTSSGLMADDFRNNGQQIDIGVSSPLFADTQGQLAYMFRMEDYQDPNSRANFIFRRHDTEHQFVVGAVHTLTANVALTCDFIGVINNSNIPNFEYDRYIISAGVRVSF